MENSLKPLPPLEFALAQAEWDLHQYEYRNGKTCDEAHCEIQGKYFAAWLAANAYEEGGH